MANIFWQNQLFTFLLYCNGQKLDKKILDCGAGGRIPPLAIFKEHGYETYGIEISDEQMKRVNEFEEKNKVKLNIQKGDMKELPFEDDSMSFVYSYNSIFHMNKEDISQTIGEIKRVIKPGGLCFINLASIDDDRFGEGEKVGEGEYLQEEHGDMVLHSYFSHNEAEKIFEKHGLDVVYKEIRVRTGPTRSGGKITLGFIDYIVENKKEI